MCDSKIPLRLLAIVNNCIFKYKYGFSKDQSNSRTPQHSHQLANTPFDWATALLKCCLLLHGPSIKVDSIYSVRPVTVSAKITPHCILSILCACCHGMAKGCTRTNMCDGCKIKDLLLPVNPGTERCQHPDSFTPPDVQHRKYTATVCVCVCVLITHSAFHLPAVVFLKCW